MISYILIKTLNILTPLVEALADIYLIGDGNCQYKNDGNVTITSQNQFNSTCLPKQKSTFQESTTDFKTQRKTVLMTIL